VPWCATCDRFLSPPTVRADGTCPTCKHPVDPGRAAPAVDVQGGAEPAKEPESRWAHVPWHVKALLGVFAIYLGYRTFQGIEWLIEQL